MQKYRYAHVKDGVVVNVSVWLARREEPLDDAGVLYVELPEGSPVGPGWTYSPGGEFEAGP